MSATPEGKFKQSFCRKLKRLGAVTVLQYKQDSTTVKGFPDTIVIFEGITIFIEFKASKRAKFQPLQKEWIKKLTDKNHFVWVAYPENEKEVLDEIRRII